MCEHIQLPGVLLRSGFLHEAYKDYLKEWRAHTIQLAENDDAAASSCLQATLIDVVLDGGPRHDWLGVMDAVLTDGDKPLAYSKVFSRRLHKFDNQYLQSTIHAIHSRWWIESLANPSAVDHERFASLILAKRQSDGLIYDHDLSETILRHRMKSELTLSMLMAVEILSAAGKLSSSLATALATELTTPSKCPPLGYMSMEYFRLRALGLLSHEALFPVGIGGHIEQCSEGLAVGWCDFSIKSKVDAYMGTAKRTQRDKPIHSPLTALHISYLKPRIQEVAIADATRTRLVDYANHLSKNPNDIPAFQMRDIPIPFGVDRTPIEVIAASSLISAHSTR